jgi:S1-C subfamily serine protease
MRSILLFMGFVMMLTVPSCTKNTEEPTNHEQAVQKLKESQECCYLEYGVREKVQGKAAKISREAAVVVHVQQPAGRYRGTGTYFKYKGRHIVVTAAHIWAESVPEPLSTAAMVESPHEQVLGKIVYWDPYVDIAILAIPALESRTPAKFTRDPEYVVGEDVVYSGFPGANSLLTFEGQLAGDGYGTDLAMNSMAWGGSSGSGVFDVKGRFVGVVSSIMVGRGFLGPQLVGTIVYVAPANLIDMNYLRENIEKLEGKKNERF